MSEQAKHERLRDLFERTAALPPVERDALLSEHPDDADMVRALLESEHRADGFLEDSPVKSVAMPSPPSLRSFGVFDVEGLLQGGTTAFVYRARSRQTGELVALKVLPPVFVSHDGLARLQREAELLAELESPGIAEIIAAGIESTPFGNLAFVATRFVDGERTLRSLARPVDDESLRASLRLFAKICRIIDDVHGKGVLHRDLKPENVLVDAHLVPTVIDFGLAAIADTDLAALTQTGDVIGSLPYISPEGFRVGTSVDNRADVWALGVTLYEHVVGERPFVGDNPEAIARAIAKADPLNPQTRNPVVGRQLRAVLECALEKDRDRRYRSAGALADDLEALASGRSVAVSSASFARRTLRAVRRYPLVVAAFAVLLLITTLVTAQMFALSRANALADEPRLEQLLLRAEALWPERTRELPRFQRWQRDLAELNSRRALHVAAAASGENEDRHRRILELLGRANELSPRVAAGIARARELRQLTLVEHADAWRRCLASLANSSRFADVTLRAREGLVPLGRDAESGLWEFWLPETGIRPRREGSFEQGKVLPLRAQDGAVMILLPPGEVLTGLSPAQQRLEAAKHAGVIDCSSAIEPVSAFLLSKFELTQGQWRRLSGSNPSLYAAELPHEGTTFDDRHPVEQVSFLDLKRVLVRFGLRAPTEAEWLRGARGGTDTLWFGGNEAVSLRGYANLWSPSFSNRPLRDQQERPRWTDLEDGYALHAPVGSFLPNPWGFYDVVGNVSEWTSTIYGQRQGEAGGLRRAFRQYVTMLGAGYTIPAEDSFLANRTRRHPAGSAPNIGVRPAMSLGEVSGR